MGHVYAGREITYDLSRNELTPRSSWHLDRPTDSDKGTQLIGVKWDCLLHQQERRPGYQKTHLLSQTFTKVVDGSDDGDLEIWQGLI